MPQKHKEALQKFLVNLVEKPHALRQLRKDPRGFISKSALATTHKQILLGNNLQKIKGLVSDAIAEQKIAIVIKTSSGAKPSPRAPAGPGPSAAIHIVFGVEQPQVKVSLRPKLSKPGEIEAEAIHIVTKTRPGP
jgi:hypothetical protein